MNVFSFDCTVASPVFQKMLETNMKEGTEGRVEIIDFNKTTVEQLIKWIYSGDLDLKQDDRDGVLNLFQASHKYCMNSLKDYLAVQIVTHHTKPETAIEIFEFGQMYQHEAVIQKAKEIIKK
jgi:hypothetical protein